MTLSAQNHHHAAERAPTSVLSRVDLTQLGVSRSRLGAALDADRWQRVGRAIVTHTGPLTKAERWQVALINGGPRAALTGFTAAECLGLRSWERPDIDIVVPPGRAPTAMKGVRVHRRPVDPRALIKSRRVHRMSSALVVATTTMSQPRSACGLLSAGVQQQLVSAPSLIEEITASVRTRHRPILLAAMRDIEMGAQALSEIDFVRLCRRYRIPPPRQQVIRTDPQGRRRYLDALWDLPDGRELVVEIDGALHLVAGQWWSDQLRQNDLVLGGRVLLRFPSVVVRTEELAVARQLARALGLPPPRLSYQN